MVKRKIINYAFLIFIFLMTFQGSSAQVISPFNSLSIADTSSQYCFVVSGHFHGESTNKSTYPASTILASIDTLNNLHPLFLMSLGDLFIDVNESYINNYNKSLFNKLRMPLFNAVGNHDLSNNNFYEKIYGKTFFSFRHGSELFIVLNTEMDDGNITAAQLDFFKNAVEGGVTDEIKNIFIFSHRPVWSENDEIYKNLFKGNTRTKLGNNNYESEIKPLLMQLSTKMSVFWMSGSMSAAPVSFFYQHEPSSNITFIQTAIRDLPRDAALKVNVNNGIVAFNGISLTGQILQPIESYNLEFWNKNAPVDEAFSVRLVPYLLTKMVLHSYFWFGFIFSLLMFFSIVFFNKKWKRKK